MEKFTLKITYKHTEKEYNNLTYSELHKIINKAKAFFNTIQKCKRLHKK